MGKATWYNFTLTPLVKGSVRYMCGLMSKEGRLLNILNFERKKGDLKSKNVFASLLCDDNTFIMS